MSETTMTAAAPEAVLRKALLPQGFRRHLGLLLILGGLLIMLLSPQLTAVSPSRAKEFDEATTGTYARLDVLWVSDWVYNTYQDSARHTYYIVCRPGDRLAVVALNSAQFDALDAQHQYFLVDDASAPAPDPAAIYGVVRTADSGLRDAVSQVCRINIGDYSSYFGLYYLDCTTRPNEKTANTLMILGWIAFLAGAIVALSDLIRSGRFKKSVKELTTNGVLSEAAEELTAAGGYPKKARTFMTGHYCYSRSTGNIVRIADIMLCYFLHTRYYFVFNSRTFRYYTKTRSDQGLGIAPQGEQAMLEAVVKGSPSVLVGRNRDNLTRLKQRRQGAPENSDPPQQ